MSITVQELALKLGLTVKGDENLQINLLADYRQTSSDSLAFVEKSKDFNAKNNVFEGAVIIPEDTDIEISAAAIMYSKNPKLSFAHAAREFTVFPRMHKGQHPSAYIATSAKLGKNVTLAPNVVIEDDVEIADDVYIGPNSVIGQGTTIGEGTSIDANVSIYFKTVIGQHCRIFSGAVIGKPGFGFVQNNGSWENFPQLGQAILGDHVDVGSNSCVDRGALGHTRVANGVKIDNFIQVAHNCEIGENTILCGHAAMAGSTIIGKNCMIGARASLQGHIEITDNVHVCGMAFVNRSIHKPMVLSSGVTAQEVHLWNKNQARLHRLDQLARRVKDLEKALIKEKNPESDSE